MNSPRTIALFWEFFDAINTELALKIPSTLGEAGLTDEQIKRAQAQVGSGLVADYVARIIDGARQGTALLAG
jgi:hypothetical protein